MVKEKHQSAACRTLYSLSSVPLQPGGAIKNASKACSGQAVSAQDSYGNSKVTKPGKALHHPALRQLSLSIKII